MFITKFIISFYFYILYIFSFYLANKMANLKEAITVLMLLLPLTVSIRKCPTSCQCDLDDKGRYYALCDQGLFIYL